MSSDEQLFQDMHRGQRAAFDRLYARHERKLFGFILAQVKNRQEAEDVFQETFQKLILQAKQGGQELMHIEAWLFTVARHLCLNRLRNQRFDEPIGETHQDFSLGIEDLFIAVQQSVALSASLNRLPPDLGKLYQLRVEGHDYATIARKLGVPVGTVKSRFHHLILRLQKELEI